MHSFKLLFPWREESGRMGRVVTELTALQSRDRYGDFRGEGEWQAWERHARICAHCAKSTVAFMDGTGLEISYSFGEVFGVIREVLPDGADHTRIWRLPQGSAGNGGPSSSRYLATTEPYKDGYSEVQAWCRENGWACATLPPGYGMWLPTGVDGTRLVLLSPPWQAAPVAELAATAEEKMPLWEED
jgi:hypothetical protein